MGIVVSYQGTDTNLRVEPPVIISMLDKLVDMGVSAQGENYVPKERIPWIFPLKNLIHWWTWVYHTKGQLRP